MNKSPQEPPDKSVRKNSKPTTRAETVDKISGSGKSYHAEMIKSSPEHFGTPYKNVGDIEPSKGPSIEDPSRDFPDQIQTRSQRKQISKVLDFAPCLKKSFGRSQQCHNAGVNLREENPTCLLTPIRVALTSTI